MADDIGFEPIDATIPAAPQDNIGFEPIDGSTTPGTFARIGAAWKNAVGSINPGTAKAAVGDYIANTVTGVPNTLLKHGIQMGAYLDKGLDLHGTGQHSWDDNYAANVANRLTPNFTAQPATPGGQALVSAVGTTLQPISDAGKYVAQSLGGGEPVQNLAGDFAPAAIGTAGGMLGDVAGYGINKVAHAAGDSLFDQWKDQVTNSGRYNKKQLNQMNQPGGAFDQVQQKMHDKIDNLPSGDMTYPNGTSNVALNSYISDNVPHGVIDSTGHILNAAWQGLKDTTNDIPTIAASGALGYATGHPVAGMGAVLAKHAINGIVGGVKDVGQQIAANKILGDSLSQDQTPGIVGQAVQGTSNIVSPIVKTGAANPQPVDVGFEPIESDDNATGLQALINRLGTKYSYGQP